MQETEALSGACQEAASPYKCDAKVPPRRNGGKRVIPWDSVRLDYTKGDSAKIVAERYGLTVNQLYVKSSQEKWTQGAHKLLQEGGAKAVKRILSHQVRKMRPEIEKRAAEAINDCVAKSIEVAKIGVSEAKRRVRGASDRDFSGIANGFKSYVGAWRESLGLSSADAAGGSVTIACHSVHLGVEEREPIADRPAVDV